MKKRLISIPAAALAFLATAGITLAATLDVYVNPSTWAIDHQDFGTAYYNAKDAVATHYDQYGYPHYRYYTYGSFNAVNIWNNNNQTELLQSLGSCNNIFYIDRTVPSAYVCSAGYDGTGNGVNGEVIVGKALQNGDFCIGGYFTSAGNYDGTSYFSCYQWNSGWSGVSGVHTDGAVSSLSFNGYYQLVVQGSFSNVYGPITSGGSDTTLSASGTAYWNEWHDAFVDCYWSN